MRKPCFRMLHDYVNQIESQLTLYWTHLFNSKHQVIQMFNLAGDHIMGTSCISIPLSNAPMLPHAFKTWT